MVRFLTELIKSHTSVQIIDSVALFKNLLMHYVLKGSIKIINVCSGLLLNLQINRIVI